METLILVIHVLVSLAIILMVLLQQGKGAETGASFGSGISQTVFGSQGTTSFMSRVTTVFVVIFFLTSSGLALFARQKADIMGIEGIPAVTESANQNSGTDSNSSSEQKANEPEEQKKEQGQPSTTFQGDEVLDIPASNEKKL